MKHLIHDLPLFLTETLLFNIGIDPEPLRLRLLAINDEAQALVDAGPVDHQRLETLFAEFDRLEGQLADLGADPVASFPELPSAGRKTAPQPITNRMPALPDQGFTDRDYAPRSAPVNQHQPFEGRRFENLFGAGTSRDLGGFRSAGEYFNIVLARLSDPRLILNSQQEGDGQSGGYAVPTQIASDLFNQTLESSVVLPRAALYRMNTSALTILAGDSEDRSAGDIAGMKGVWLGEATLGAIQTTRLRTIEMRSSKLAIFGKVSAELLSDAPDFERQLRKIMVDAAGFTFDEAFLTGDGAGKPNGILNSPSTITVQKESGQAADTIVYTNLVKMWSRLLPSSTGNAVWLAHPSVVPALFQLSFEGATSSVPAYLPAMSGLSGSAPNTLFGRPLTFTEKLRPLGDSGDIVLVDLSKYAVGVRQEMDLRSSIDAAFLSDEITFRLIMRIAGKPLMDSPVTPRSGAQTLSWCLKLEDRV